MRHAASDYFSSGTNFVFGGYTIEPFDNYPVPFGQRQEITTLNGSFLHLEVTERRTPRFRVRDSPLRIHHFVRPDSTFNLLLKCFVTISQR
jgi:hypothetical protein